MPQVLARAPIGETLVDHDDSEKKEFYTVVGSLADVEGERAPGVETVVLVWHSGCSTRIKFDFASSLSI